MATGEATSTTDPALAARWTVFVHQDGIILCTALRSLHIAGLLEPALEREASLAELSPQPLPPTGYGYLRVALRSLASQGWLEEPPTLDPATTVLRWTAAGRAALGVRDLYIAGGELLAGFDSGGPRAWAEPWSDAQRARFLALADQACRRWPPVDEVAAPGSELHSLIIGHLDAAVLVPATLTLRARRRLLDERPVLDDGDELSVATAALFAALGWTDEGGAWTAEGARGSRLSRHFGMAASYLPLLAALPDLFAARRAVARAAPGSVEWHVNRALNVNASAAAHSRYFADADDVIAEVFNGELDRQPRFIADIGCGDGSWLVHLHELISRDTTRGTHLDTAPLTMVGLDVNQAALDEASVVLGAAGVPCLLVLGDISDPDSVAETLREHGLEMSDGLHVRAFIDHDRVYRGPPGPPEDPAVAVPGCSSGSYVGPTGAALDGAAVERDLVAHLARWVPHVEKHGLVMLEAHSVDPSIAREHLGATHSVAFDAYHGYSHQYPIEHAAHLRCCQLAGLQPSIDHQRTYPASRPFVAVSLNRLTVPVAGERLPDIASSERGDDGWRPAPDTDLTDGRALHELLYQQGDVRWPRGWCSAATGFVVAGTIAAVEERLRDARPGETIRVLDYGAGTGLASIELLKLFGERELDRRLDESGVTFELHLVDLPSSWFAQGYELLGGLRCARFHSLRAAGGGFRELSDAVGGATMDAVMANMVFHLIPPRGLARAAAALAAVTAPGGRLLVSSPDLAPAGEHAVLFHDANRALRRAWLEHLAGDTPAVPGSAVAAALERATGSSAAHERAGRRVLPIPNAAGDVADALCVHYAGDLERPAHELLAVDVLDTLLVPANQTEYLPEIADPSLRGAVVRELMTDDVLPAMRAGPGGTSLGLNVRWTLGSFERTNQG